jgi:UDP-N-acetylmuramoyl-tripeptide--D-alanyl-D-alanine ligase
MSFFIRLPVFLLWITPAFAMALSIKQLMQFVQLSSYQAGGFIRAVWRQKLKCFWPGFALSALSIVLLFIASIALQTAPLPAFVLSLLIIGMILLAGFILGFLSYREKKVKIKLVLTARMKRLYAAFLLVALLVCWLLWYVGLPFGSSALVPVFLPVWLLLALFIVWPFEKVIQLLYRADAGRILEDYRKTGLKVIGLTGSYGKTTVKNILHAMLSQSFPTLASPASFNTPLGLARCIREELGQQHHYFIAEMGARHPQDIRVLCRMIKPEAGILTSIGPQHLETLGSLARVRDTKYDLIRSLPADGYAVFHDDGKLVQECWQKTEIKKALVGSPGSDLWAEDVRLSPEGSRFMMCQKDGRRFQMETRLAGAHNVQNILLAAAMALHEGVSLEKIAQALEEVQPVASRLQMTIHPRGFKVINNGFNSNPESSRKALEVLAGQPGRLIVVTPGFIELGRQEAPSNQRLGNDIAAVARMALLIGEKHTRPIKAGLLESGMGEDNIKTFSSLAEANIYIEEVFGPGDVLLYENDLPDHYA